MRRAGLIAATVLAVAIPAAAGARSAPRVRELDLTPRGAIVLTWHGDPARGWTAAGGWRRLDRPDGAAPGLVWRVFGRAVLHAPVARRPPERAVRHRLHTAAARTTVSPCEVPDGRPDLPDRAGGRRADHQLLRQPRSLVR